MLPVFTARPSAIEATTGAVGAGAGRRVIIVWPPRFMPVQRPTLSSYSSALWHCPKSLPLMYTREEVYHDR